MNTFNGMNSLLADEYRDYVVALAGAIAVDYRFRESYVAVLTENGGSCICLDGGTKEKPVNVEVDFGYYLKKKDKSLDMQSLYVRIFLGGDNCLSLRYRVENDDDPIKFIEWLSNEITGFCNMLGIGQR